jgi:Sel1 repeat-containing protein
MMSAFGKIAVPVCVVAIGAAAIFWNVERIQTNGRRFADDAKQYRLRADQGDAHAQYELGQIYMQARGVPRDYAQAKFWYQKAGDQGLAKAEYAIGCLYYYGDGVWQSYSDALVWYQKAAAQGDAIAQEALGGMYYNGNGMPRNYAEALAWYRKAADQGDARSEYDIGVLYDYGLGVSADHDEASRWYRKATAQGDRYAQGALGLRFSPLRPSVRNTMAMLSLGCLLLLWDFISPKRLLRNRDAPGTALGGALGFLQIGLYVYEHSEYCLFPSAQLAMTVRIATGFLGGIVVTLLASGVWRTAAKTLLIAAGLWGLAIAVLMGAAARFDVRVLSAAGWRILALESYPLGMAAAAALHLWRGSKETTSGESETPGESGETPHAV